MRKWKNIILFTAFCLILVFGTGCGKKEKQAAETSVETAESVESKPLPDFPVKPKPVQIDLPSSYNYIEENRMPMLRNQGGTNTCWAFAALSALESSKDADAEGMYSVDHLIFHNPFGKRFDEGGSYLVTMAYLLSWIGPVPEEADPFDGKSVDGLTPSVHVQEIRLSEPKDYEAIKKFVYLYGGVESALYLDFNEYISESAYYNKESHAYCYQGDQISNHDVVIVGWDDDYPAENFVGNVSSDGAFLCQNSWGEAFGDSGVFYVSYEDVNIGGYGVAYSRVDPADNYDKIYQADLCGYTAQIGYGQETCWFANAYKAEEEIQLRAVGFYATGKHTNYEIYVVPKFSNQDSFAAKQFICSGYLEDAGYYTIDFPEEIKIAAGNEFAVVVKINTENGEYPVAIECQVEGLSEDANLSDGKGYLSFQGLIWEHIEATKKYNICLKAYADLR